MRAVIQRRNRGHVNGLPRRDLLSGPQRHRETAAANSATKAQLEHGKVVSEDEGYFRNRELKIEGRLDWRDDTWWQYSTSNDRMPGIA